MTPCKACRRTHQPKAESRKSALTVPVNRGEQMAMNYLLSRGIPTLPGKAVAASDVDLVCWGSVWVEVKYSRAWGGGGFIFTASTDQQRRGYLAHVVVLVCEHDDQPATFHIFDARDPVFYRLKDGKSQVKKTVYYRYGALAPGKARYDVVPLLKPAMDAAQDRVGLLHERLADVERDLLAGYPQAYSARREPQNAFYQEVIARMNVAPPAPIEITPLRRKVKVDGLSDEDVAFEFAKESLLATARGDEPLTEPAGDSLLDYIDWAQSQKRSA